MLSINLENLIIEDKITINKQLDYVVSNIINNNSHILKRIGKLPQHDGVKIIFSKEQILNLPFILEIINSEQMKQILNIENVDANISFNVNSSKVGFNEEETNKLVDIHNFLIENKYSENGVEFNSDITSLTDVLLANRKMNEEIKLINESKINGDPLSPFEKYLMVYQYVAGRKYKEGKGSDCRSIVQVETGDKIVCTGFSNLLRYICQQVGLECESQDLAVYDKEIKLSEIKEDTLSKFTHSNNIIYLKDDKYNIDGLFYVDSCWDAYQAGSFAKDIKNISYLNHALLPFSDIDKIKEGTIEIDDCIPYQEISGGAAISKKYIELTNKYADKKENPKLPTEKDFIQALKAINGWSEEETKDYIKLNEKRAKTLFEPNCLNCFCSESENKKQTTKVIKAIVEKSINTEKSDSNTKM